MAEHPFAQYVRILGKGPRLSRALTFEETRAAVGMILAGEVEPVQLGAFLCLMRVRTETAEEVAGFATALRQSLPRPSRRLAVDLDWPSYAGKSRRLPLFLLAALLLAANGIRILIHGGEGPTAGRLYSGEALASLGIAGARSADEAADQLERHNLAYVPMDALNPRLAQIMDLKWLLGVRSPLHTAIRHLNPFDAPASLLSVFHPNYRAVHGDAGALLGMSELACFKGDGGEAERRPEKPCLVEGLRHGQRFTEEWPSLLSGPVPAEPNLDPSALAALWRRQITDIQAEATVTGTAAVALRLLGRAASAEEAEALARRLWSERPEEA